MGVKLVAEHKIRALRRWRALMMAPAVGLSLFGLLLIDFMVGIIQDAIEQAPCTCERLTCEQSTENDDCAMCCYANEEYPRQLSSHFLFGLGPAIISLVVGYPAAMAWYFSMKVTEEIHRHRSLFVESKLCCAETPFCHSWLVAATI